MQSSIARAENDTGYEPTPSEDALSAYERATRGAPKVQKKEPEKKPNGFQQSKPAPKKPDKIEDKSSKKSEVRLK